MNPVVMPAEEYEGLCQRCGIACHGAVWVEGRQIVVEDLTCTFYGDLPDGTKGCTVYEDRFKKAPWCMNAFVAVHMGALRVDCPYHIGGPNKKGKLRVSPAEYDRLWPRIAQELAAQPNVNLGFTWDRFITSTKRRDPDYTWKVIRSAVSRDGRLVRTRNKRKEFIMAAKGKISRFFQKWIAFFRPVDGWEKRLRLFLGGQTTWEVPGHPESSKVVPWPVQWIPHRISGPEDTDDQGRGFSFIIAHCVETGTEMGIGKGTCCVRCGVTLDEKKAHMITGFSPPHCKRCHVVLLIKGLLR